MFRLGLISTNFILSQAELNKKCPTYPEGYIGHIIPVVAMQLVRLPTGVYGIQQEPPCVKFVSEGLRHCCSFHIRCYDNNFVEMPFSTSLRFTTG